MLLKSDAAGLEQILEYISDIMEIVSRHKTIINTLHDIEGQYAVMLCLSQIGEILGKIKSQDIVDQLPVRLATGLRNAIIHNYDGIDLTIIENTIKHQIPELKIVIAAILEDM